MGKNPPSSPPPPPPPVCGSSSSGQKRKAVVMENDDVPPPSWLSLASMDYGDDVGSSSCAASATTPTSPAAHVDDASAAASAILATSTGEFLADHHATGDGGNSNSMAAAAGDDDAAVRAGNSIAPNFFNSFPPSTTHAGSSSSATRSTVIRRRSSNAAASTPSSSDSADDHNDAGKILPNPPYPWATNKLAKHHTIAELSRRGITSIEGETKCRRCDKRNLKTYNISEKFQNLIEYFIPNHRDMNDRASNKWMNPRAQDCVDCGQKNCVRPVIAAEKERINWLFLLLDETLGFCTLDQLKFLCEHTKRHRTGAKDRLLFSAYEELCCQLVPGNLPFERECWA
uniref:DUF7086 domain-containing protein n=1 Tax=Leersia perrieri TaxID=77586 RepID=A0A0D9WJD2_9ORYZ